MSSCDQPAFRRIIGSVWYIFVAALAISCASERTFPGDTIMGQAGKPGIAGAAVFICDAKTGIPLDAETHRSMLENYKQFKGFLFVRTDDQGRFCFTNIQPGKYRLVAQSLQGDNFLSPSEKAEFYGTAENIVVPSWGAQRVAIHPVGSGTLTLDQEFPDGSSVFVSTRPLAGDPILGFLGWSDDFVSHIVGYGTVPNRRSITLRGLPERHLHVVIFVNDEILPFGAADYPVLPKTPQRIPIVSGSSESQHEPPPKIRHIMDVLAAHKTTATAIISAEPAPWPRNADANDYLRILKPWLGPLDRMVVLPNGEKATVADVYAAECYKRLLEKFGKR